jgi:hypothetical protein
MDGRGSELMGRKPQSEYQTSRPGSEAGTSQTHVSNTEHSVPISEDCEPRYKMKGNNNFV